MGSQQSRFRGYKQSLILMKGVASMRMLKSTVADFCKLFPSSMSNVVLRSIIVTVYIKANIGPSLY
jgi:hypothetical protein